MVPGFSFTTQQVGPQRRAGRPGAEVTTFFAASSGRGCAKERVKIRRFRSILEQVISTYSHIATPPLHSMALTPAKRTAQDISGVAMAHQVLTSLATYKYSLTYLLTYLLT